MKKKYLPLIIFVSFLFYMTSTGFFKIFEEVVVNNDGSGTAHIVYSELVPVTQKNGYIISSFPFGEQNIREYFSSENVKIENLKIAKPGDTAYMVILDLKFRNLGDLNELKAFSDMKIVMTSKNADTDFKWTINGNENTMKINSLMTHISFKGEVGETNGMIKDGSVRWYKEDFKNNNVLSATVKGDLLQSAGGKMTSPVTTETSTLTDKKDKVHEKEVSQNNENEKKVTDENKTKPSCSLFGIELPVILIAGWLIHAGKRKASSSV